MNKKQKMIILGAIVVAACMIALIIVLIVKNAQGSSGEAGGFSQEQVDSLKNANEQLQIANEQMALQNQFDDINEDFLQYEAQQKYLKNDSLVKQYNEAKQKVERLFKELNQEKANNSQNKKRIKELEAEISTLKNILKHYLEEIERLSKENEGLRQEVEATRARNEELSSQVSATSSRNEALSQTVQLAKKLNITGLSLQAFNKKDKREGNITKAKKLGVSFTISPNNTAAPGMKDVYVRILSPEGTLLGGGGSFSFDGSTVGATAHRQVEYANDELPVSVYWPVNTTLTPGDYTVEVFCDGYRLASRRFTMKK